MYTYNNSGGNTIGLHVLATNGCRDTTSRNINVLDKPTAIITASDTFVCVGNSVNFSALSSTTPTSGLTYAWDVDFNTGIDNTNNSFTILANDSRLIMLEVEDANGCIDIIEVVIDEVNDLAGTVTINQEPICGDSNGSVTISATGGTGNYTYRWTGNRTGATISNLGAGSYSATATDANGCEETVTITVNPLLCTGFSVAINTESLTSFDTNQDNTISILSDVDEWSMLNLQFYMQSAGNRFGVPKTNNSKVHNLQSSPTNIETLPSYIKEAQPSSAIIAELKAIKEQ